MGHSSIVSLAYLTIPSENFVVVACVAGANWIFFLDFNYRASSKFFPKKPCLLSRLRSWSGSKTFEGVVLKSDHVIIVIDF